MVFFTPGLQRLNMNVVIQEGFGLVGQAPPGQHVNSEHLHL